MIVDKEAGWTSHDVVAKVRRIAGTRRVGHAGTLDPFATGVLVVCIGRATRLVQFLVGLDKEYEATVRLGFATDTHDLTGKQIGVLRSSNGVTEEAVTAVLKSFVGSRLQTPPMYSAKKVSGERLYRAAREGREVARRPSSITIHSIELLSDDGMLHRNDDGTTDFRIGLKCSSGTYVRTIAHEIGEELGAGAHLTALRRTAVGEFRLDDASTLAELEALARAGALSSRFIRPAELVKHLPLIQATPAQAVEVAQGKQIGVARALSGMVRLCDGEGNLLAIGVTDATRMVFKPQIVMTMQAVD